jgi:DeoR family transcriptional regulator, suf operon transcriptional repressor
MLPVSSPSQPHFPLTGYRGIRAQVLVELKKADGLTTRELATKLGVSLNAVRHHLKELDEQGLVEYQREHRGVGAPTFAYRLTLAGKALFPRRYEAVLDGLLGQLIDQAGRAAVGTMLEARYSTLAERLRDELAGASPNERLIAMARVLAEEGYMAESTYDGSSGTLIEHNCAILSVAERFPEICAAEARFLTQALGASVQRERHILNGCTACEYRVRFDAPESTGSATQEHP